MVVWHTQNESWISPTITYSTCSSWNQSTDNSSSNMVVGPYRFRSKAEQKLDRLLAEFSGELRKLQTRLRRQAEELKAIQDAESRERRPHPSTRRVYGMRLQTQQAAMAVRRLSGRRHWRRHGEQD